MLVNCPRCAFSQPKDQYCAQCGIDMQSYKPKEAPLLNRILGNTVLQILALFIAAVFVGQYIFHSQQQQSWVQKITHFKGFNKSEKSPASPPSENEDGLSEAAQTTAETKSASKALQSEAVATTNRSSEGGNTIAGANFAGNSGAAQDLSVINFKITYAEISSDMLTKWITDSSSVGLYQNLQEYSAGIIYDFKKRGDKFQQNLKTAELKLNLGSSNSNLSGLLSEDDSPPLGLVTAVEYRSHENDVIQGNISVTKIGLRGNETYPAEFALPKGAVFFMIGAVKRNMTASERAKLDMPPFQIMKSPDFMTRKTEFVIILEPDYK